MKTDKRIEEIAQEHLPYMKILEEAGSFAVFLSDRFRHYYYATEYIDTPQELDIEKLVHPDDLEVVKRIDKISQTEPSTSPTNLHLIAQ